MRDLLETYRSALGILAIALFFWMAAWSKRLNHRRQKDKEKFLLCSALKPAKDRTEQLQAKLRSMIPRWHRARKLLHISDYAYEISECRTTLVCSHEITYVRFCEKLTMPNGSSTNVECPRSVFLIPCNLGADPFTIVLDLDLPLPKIVSKTIHSLSSSLSGDSVSVGDRNEIVLRKAENATGDFTIFRRDGANVASHVDGKLQQLMTHVQKAGILGITYYDATLAVETIYDTPNNFRGPRQLVNAEDLWVVVDSFARSL